MKFLRFPDLVARGIVDNRVTLRNWINDLGFPPGRMLGPNTRAFPEQEVEEWLESRPIANKPEPAHLQRARAASRRNRAQRQAEKGAA